MSFNRTLTRTGLILSLLLFCAQHLRKARKILPAVRSLPRPPKTCAVSARHSERVNAENESQLDRRKDRTGAQTGQRCEQGRG